MANSSSDEGQPCAKRIKLSKSQAASGHAAPTFESRPAEKHFHPITSAAQSGSKSRMSLEQNFGTSPVDMASKTKWTLIDPAAPVFSPAKQQPLTPSTPQTPMALDTSAPSLKPTSSSPHLAAPNDASQLKRHVSGPGQFTPRALLKSEEEFEQIGVNAGEVLALTGNQISWWMAEQIIWLHQYLECPQKGAPSSLDARPRENHKDEFGVSLKHCCSNGGITHLKPCNIPLHPQASDAFHFAASLREGLLPQHHASKGGINTIAYVGDLVLEKLAGISRIDEEEFKLVAGSEHIRQFHGRGYKRYKAADPNVDPTKQPILILKSLKKLSQNQELVVKLKGAYVWALQSRSRLADPHSPGNQLEASYDSRSPSMVKLAPAVKASLAPPPPRRERKNNYTPVQRRTVELPIVHDDNGPDSRVARRPEFPLKGLSSGETKRVSAAVEDVCDVLEEMFQPHRHSQSEYAGNLQSGTAHWNGTSHETKSRAKERNDADEGADLLLSLANGNWPPARKSNVPADRGAADNISLTLPFELNFSSQMDRVLENLIEKVIDDHIRATLAAADDRRISMLKAQLVKLRKLFSQMQLRCNMVVGSALSAAISRLARILLLQAGPDMQNHRGFTGDLAAGQQGDFASARDVAF